MIERKFFYPATFKCLAYAAFAFLFLLTTIQASLAGSKAGPIFEDVIVTVQKPVEDAQDTEGYISSLTGEQIEAFAYSSLGDLTSSVPGVRLVQPNGAGSYNFSIRGVTQNDTAEHQESPTAVYFDEVYVSQMAGVALQLFDTDRVEILRGPQGTQAGRNSTGGAVQLFSRRPSADTRGYLKTTVGEYNLVRMEGAIGGALLENQHVLGRLSFATNRHSGLVENTLLGQDSENGNDKAIRGQLLFNLPKDSSLLIIGRYGHKDVRAGAWESLPSSVTADGYGVFGATTNGFGLGPSGHFRTAGDTQGYAKINHGGLTAKFETLITSLDDAQLTTIFDYQHLRKKYLEDSDTSLFPVAAIFYDSRVYQYSAEARLMGQLAALKWLGGVYFLKMDGQYIEGAQGSALGGLVDPYSLKTSSQAIFGQTNYAITDRLEVNAGARYTLDKKDFNFISNMAGMKVFEFSPQTVGNQTHLNDGFWSGKLGLDYQLTPSSLLYANYSRGVKSGGFNAPIAPFLLANSGTGVIPFKHEILDAYEIGSKHEFWDHQVRLSTALFYYDYKNSQAFHLFGFTQLIKNAPARHVGGEVDLQLAPSRQWLFELGASYTDAHVRDVDLGLGPHSYTPANAPRWSGNALARYTWHLDAGTLSFQVDGQVLSSQYFALSNSPVTKQSGYGVANARARYTSVDKKYEWGLDVTNLLDKDYALMAVDGSLPFGLTQRYPGKPRWTTVSITYHFD